MIAFCEFSGSGPSPKTAAPRHGRRRLLQPDFDRQRSTRATQGRGDLAHLAGRMDARISDEFDLNRNVSIDGLLPNTDSFTLKTASRGPSWASTKTRCPADIT